MPATAATPTLRVADRRTADAGAVPAPAPAVDGAAETAMREESLVVQTSYPGDVVLTTPLIAELAMRGPVDVVVTPLAAPVLANNPFVRHLFVYDKRGERSGMLGLWHTARELRGRACEVLGRTVDGQFEILVGAEGTLDRLNGGPQSPEARPIALERGGMGLALIHAALVLDAHGAARWTVNDSRQLFGVRLPLSPEPR